MKKYIVLDFVDTGIINITTNTLDAHSAYKVYKFKREIDKRYKDILDERLSLISSVFGQNYDAEINDLKRLTNIGEGKLTESEASRLKDLREKNDKANKLINEMLNDDIKLDNVQPIPYEDWNALKKENDIRMPFDFEKALEGIFWSPLKENDF